MTDLGAKGQADLSTLAARLRTADKALMKELRASVVRAAKPLEDAIVDNARSYMPSGYGPVLARFLRNRITQRAGSSGFVVTMTTIATGKSERRAIKALDEGNLRHPVFGRTRYRKYRDGKRIPGRGQPIPNPWVRQSVRAGFWS
ncbi:MAG TPA: hypothetical protein VF174_14550, partial [Micromonosporaceae bacterium]